MAEKHDIRKGKDVIFADGVTRTIRPLTIKQLRKFVPIIDKMGSSLGATSMSEEDIDNMVDAAQIILQKVDSTLADDRDAVEDSVDMRSFNEMMGVAMGNADPNE